MRKGLSFLNLAALGAGSPLAIRHNNSNTNGSTITFADIAVTQDIRWVPCYGGNFTCVSLEVPLDYDDTTVGSTNIAFMKHAAPVQPPLGDMIFNPGGPGGSGVGMVLGYERWRPILGQRYGLIGMDPRSVNNSGPNVDHLIDKAALHNEYAAEMSFKYHSNSPGAVKKTFVHAGAYGNFAPQELSDDVNHVNTPAVAPRHIAFHVSCNFQSWGKPRRSKAQILRRLIRLDTRHHICSALSQPC
jgi:hypothetical protein